MKYTPLELSIKLAENNCTLASDKSWFHNELMTTKYAKSKKKRFEKMYGQEYKDKKHKIYPAYKLLDSLV